MVIGDSMLNWAWVVKNEIKYIDKTVYPYKILT